MKTFRSGIIILLCSIILGLLFLCAVYMLPTGPMRQKMLDAEYAFEIEGTYYAPSVTEPSTYLDNYTDALMLQIAIFDSGKPLLDRTLSAYNPVYEGLDPVQRFSVYLSGTSYDSVGSYGRYWHGYLVLLKPLLALFDYSQIRLINGFMQTLMIVGIIVLLYRKSFSYSILPFSAALLYLVPSSVAMSLQYSSVFYITMTALLLMLWKPKFFIDGENCYLFFLSIGILTSFFDLLTYPIVTLGLPLILYFIITPQSSVKDAVLKLLVIGLCWCLGYALMWAGKWVINAILCDPGSFADAKEAISFRLSDNYNGQIFSIPYVWGIRLDVYSSLPWVLLLLFSFALMIVLAYRSGNSHLKNKDPRTPALLCIVLCGLFPFVWWAVVRNHSAIHMFTSKCVAVTVFAALSFFAVLSAKPDARPAVASDEAKKKRKK